MLQCKLDARMFSGNAVKLAGGWKRTVSNIARSATRAPALEHLLINEKTKVVYQGFTGTTATNNAKEAIAHGTHIVGGVSKNKSGTTHLGLPVFDTISQAAKYLRPDASLVYVPAVAAANAIEQAIEAEVPLIVSLAEHVPAHDMLRVHQMLRTQTASRLLGPNCPGIIAPSKCRVGIIPAAQCSPGRVGIISRSGTMIYEAVGATGRVGLGQSLVIGLGGDTMPGTTMEDALKVLIAHDQTDAIILIGEIGGNSEFRTADCIRDYYLDASATTKKPIIAIISGRTAPQGRVMGHAGALLSPGEQGAMAKARALEDAGAVVLPHLGMLDRVLQNALCENT